MEIPTSLLSMIGQSSFLHYLFNRPPATCFWALLFIGRSVGWFRS